MDKMEPAWPQNECLTAGHFQESPVLSCWLDQTSKPIALPWSTAAICRRAWKNFKDCFWKLSADSDSQAIMLHIAPFMILLRMTPHFSMHSSPLRVGWTWEETSRQSHFQHPESRRDSSFPTPWFFIKLKEKFFFWPQVLSSTTLGTDLGIVT